MEWLMTAKEALPSVYANAAVTFSSLLRCNEIAEDEYLSLLIFGKSRLKSVICYILT